MTSQKDNYNEIISRVTHALGEDFSLEEILEDKAVREEIKELTGLTEKEIEDILKEIVSQKLN